MTAKLLRVNNIDLALLKSNPPQLSITVFGSSPTTGWTNTHLVPYVYIMPPEGGIYDFDLVGTPPSGPAGEMISPAVANYIWPEYPSDLKGVRVHASLNKAEEMLADDTKSINYD
ncbi:hypothetical protein [Marinomonas lutimaris]|uniref:hypothetical protein n=1 Tax=Marinomonas lutimaris TaxID=2846746 RepID=UPI001CA4E57A|nr:hypothetical protein [Marinomonas lutimaris]